MYMYNFFFFFFAAPTFWYINTLLFFGCTRGMQKFLGQGLNLRHSNNLSHSSDNARFSTC